MTKSSKKLIVIAALVMLLLALTVPVASAAGGGVHHVVSYGETLYSIGRLYGVNPYHIADVNNIWNPHHIYAGEVLYIPTYGGGYYHQPVSYRDGCYGGYCGSPRHVVAYGETLFGIAARYGVSPWAIANVNGIYNVNHIYAGQVLYIPSSPGYYYY